MAGVRTGAQGVLALGVGAGARQASGSGAGARRRQRHAGAGARRRATRHGRAKHWRACGRVTRCTGVGGSDARGVRQAQAGARGAAGLCASSVRSWARLGILVHLTQFLAWFDSVFS